MKDQPPQNYRPQPSHPYSQQTFKKPLVFPWVIAIIAAFIIGLLFGEILRSAQVTPQPNISGPWSLTHTFSGNGAKKTEIISVAKDWKIQWMCQPKSFDGLQYNVVVYVYSSDSTKHDIAINTLCKDDNIQGETDEHTGGDVYLAVNSESVWTLTIWELGS